MSCHTARRVAWRSLTIAVFSLTLNFSVQRAQATTSSPTGVLEVCKTSDPASPVTGSFVFNITGAAGGVITRSVPVGACSGPITLPAGEATITEVAVVGVGVNSITAVGLSGAPLNRLVRSDLGARSAVVTIVAGDVSKETVATFRNYRVPTGYLEVCKDAAPGTSFPAGTSFTFTISGVPGTRTVPVGACSGPIQVPAGSVTITEAAKVGASLVDIVSLPPGRLVSKNIPGLTGTFTIVSGDISTETVARFINTPATGQLKICKIGSPGIAPGTIFMIRAGNVTTPCLPALLRRAASACLMALFQ